MLGDMCNDSVGAATCGDGQWCVQEMNVNGGYGLCTALCDPSSIGACPSGYECAPLYVSTIKGSPTVNVCQVPPGDASIPFVDASAPQGGFDGGTAPEGGPIIPPILTGPNP